MGEDVLTLPNIANALAIFFVVLLAGVGQFLRMRNERRSPQSSQHSSDLQVAGALIDSTQARSVIRAIDENTRALERNTEVCQGVRDGMEHTNQNIRELTVEFIRSGKS